METSPLLEQRNTQQDEAPEKRLPIRTFHCRFCSHLLIASTRDLLSTRKPLQRRRQQRRGRRLVSTTEARDAVRAGDGGADGDGGVGGLDGALILEIPFVSSSSVSAQKVQSSRTQESEKELVDETPAGDKSSSTTVPEIAHDKTESMEQINNKIRTEQAHYTIPLSTLIPDSAPVVIRREDGFERRKLLRCGRCRVVVGYELDDAEPSTKTGQSAATTDEVEPSEEAEDTEEMGYNAKSNRAKDRVIYLLPGSIVGTADLQVGMDDGQTDSREGTNVLDAMIERNSVLKGMEKEWMDWVET